MNRLIKQFIKRKLYPRLIYHIPSEYIYLTFDDGPDLRVTPYLLDILDNFGIKATFFLEGKKMEDHPKVVEMIRDREHAIGCHSYRHRSIRQNSFKELSQNISKCQNIFDRLNLGKIEMFRPPYGEMSLSNFLLFLKKNIYVVNWSVDSRDSFHISETKIMNSLKPSYIKPGDILLFHDDSKRVLTLLPQVIEDLLSRGRKFNKIETELL